MDSLIPLQEEHHYLESIIERGRQTFIEVGTALMTIRETKSYRTDGYDTFEEYCQERWGWTHQRAYQLMQAAEVVHELKSATTVASVDEAGADAEISPIGETEVQPIPLPMNERQVRALSRIAHPSGRALLWEESVDRYGANVTGAQIGDVLREWTVPEEAAEPQLSALAPISTLHVEPPRQPVAKNDSIHLALKHLSLATMIDPVHFIESAGGIEDILSNNIQMLEQIERAQEWLRRYADALRQRLGVEPQQIRRV